MAGGTNVDVNFFLGRVGADIVNNNKGGAYLDFAYGQFVALENFFTELSRIQTAIAQGKTVEIAAGVVVDIETIGGAIALNIYMETLDSTKSAMEGLSKLGLKNENKLWGLR